MTATYDCIATTTTSNNATSVTFSSIPSTYTDLILIENYALSTLAQSVMTFNSSTTGYSNTNIIGTGSAANSTRFTGVSGIGSSPGSGDTANRFIVLIRQINNYSNANTFKTVIQRRNDAQESVWATVALWQSTNAITTIKCEASSGSFNNGSTFTLYGIKSEA